MSLKAAYFIGTLLAGRIVHLAFRRNRHAFKISVTLNWETAKMKRREVLTYAAGLATFAALKPAAASDGLVEFSPELYAEMLENGKHFMVGFLSNW